MGQMPMANQSRRYASLLGKPYTPLAKHRSGKCRVLLAQEIGLEKGMLVLEIGSGGGSDALWFASPGVDFVALDVSFDLCIAIKERFKRAKSWHLNIFVVRADGQHLPFQDSTFDVIFCKAVLHHLRNPRHAIVEMHRTVKKNGVVAAIDEPNALNPLWHIARFLVLHLNSRAYFLSANEFLYEGTNRRKFVLPLYRWQLEQYFKQAPFQFVRTEHIWLPYVTYNRAYFKVWLLLERLVEKSFIPYVFGQLFTVSRK